MGETYRHVGGSFNKYDPKKDHAAHGGEKPAVSPESDETPTTKVILEFMRHGKREQGATPEEDSSPNLRLQPIGRRQADEKGHDLNAQPEVSLGWGSPRVRSQETAYRAMLANTGAVGPDDTLEEIEAAIAEHIPASVGKKKIVDPRLDFRDDGPIGPDAKAAYNEGRYMKWMMEVSDQEAIEKGDAVSSTYLRSAGNIAEIVLRYTNVGNNFNRIVAADASKKYEPFGNQLERYLGTHQGVVECFVAKVLEVLGQGDLKREFLHGIGGGFAETEGIRIEILNAANAQKAVMLFDVKDPADANKKRTERVEFGKKVLQKIIEERKEFEAHIPRPQDQGQDHA